MAEFDDGFRKVEGKDYEVFHGLEDEDDGSELVTKLQNDNIALTAKVQELEDERDKWKEEAETSDGIIEKLNFKISSLNRKLVAFDKIRTIMKEFNNF